MVTLCRNQRLKHLHSPEQATKEREKSDCLEMEKCDALHWKQNLGEQMLGESCHCFFCVCAKHNTWY